MIKINLKIKLIIAISGILFLGYAGLAFAREGIILSSAITQMESTEVNKIITVHDLTDIRQALGQAKSKGLKVSIAGARHAQGGQQSYPNGIVLDLTEFNKIISLDQKQKIIRAQSGVTWKQIQDFIKPYGYTVRVMQTTNIFTLGGSLSSNIHGKDTNFGTIIESVESFHLMLADGSVINVSRQENPELFSLVIGGYGLFGIILDVDILLTDNVVYKENSVILDYKKYPEYFQSNIQNNPQIAWLEAYFVKSKKDNLQLLKVTTYSKITGKNPVRPEKGYTTRFALQDKTFKYTGHGQAILQEYFVPINKFVSFIDGLRDIFKTFKKITESDHSIRARINVLRYVKMDKQSFLPYAKVDSFSIEIIISTKNSLSVQKFKDIQKWTKRIVDLSLSCNGTFYLTKVAIWPDKVQLLKAYPEFIAFIEKKEKYDPQEIFMNQFLSHYH